MRAERTARVREALLSAGEQLFATAGFQGTSDRQIVLRAGQRNNSAIAYHFGSREGLVEAIWYWHSAPVNLRRAEMMSQMSDPPTAYELVSAHVDPFVEEMLSYSPSFWARFNEQHLLELQEQFVGPATERLTAREDGSPLLVLMQLFALMRDRLTACGAEDSDLRVSLLVRLVISGLASWERSDQFGSRTDSLARRAEVIKEMGAAMLSPGSVSSVER